MTALYGSMHAQSAFKLTIDAEDLAADDPKSVALRSEASVLSGATLNCANWEIFVTDKKMATGIIGLGVHKVADKTKAPLEVRLNIDFISTKGDWYKISLSKEYCGHEINLNGSGPIYAVQCGCSYTGTCNTTCNNECGTCDGYARYRILYDFNNQKICMQHRDKDDVWHDLNHRLMRPAVNQFIHFDVINYNPLRDSLSLKYQFESLNLEGSQELIAALMRTPAATSEATEQSDANNADTSAVTLNEENGNANKGSNPKGIDTLNLSDTKIKELLQKSTKNLLDKANTSFEEIPKDNIAKSSSYLSFFQAYQESPLNILGMPSEAAKMSESQIKIKYGLQDGIDIKELKDSILLLSTAFKKIHAYEAAYELTQLADQFNKKLEEEKKLPTAPDRSRLKSDLNNIIKSAEALYVYAQIPAEKAADIAKKLKVELKAAGLEDGALEELEKKGKEIDTLYEKMTNYSTSYFAPIQMQDFDRLNLQFVSGKKEVNATPYRIYAKGGWKIDFSAGFSVSNLNNKSYYYSDVTTETVVTGTNVVGGDTTITTREDKYGTIGLKKDAPDWSICTMAHFYPRTGLIFNPAVAFGAQISQDNVALLFGFSALFGREQRMAISGGLALGSASRLKPGYEVDDVVLDANAVKQGAVNFTEDRHVAGVFASLTYNLGGITKSKK